MCDQLDHSMGSYMQYFQVLCILLSMAMIYLLTKLIIEKKNGNQWEELDAKDDVAFKDIGIVIPQEDGVSHEYDWTDLYGELKPGDYRINVKVWAGNKEYVLSPHFLIR